MVRQFVGDRKTGWLTWAFALCSLSAILVLTLSGGHLAARITVASVCMGSLEVAIVLALLHPRMKHMTASWYTVILFAANAALNFGRGAITLAHGAASDLMAPTTLNELYFLAIVITVVGWVIGFLMLAYGRLTEDLMKAENTATRASLAKSEFLAKISHEVRTPLNGVIGLTSVALDGDLNETKRQDLEVALQSAHNLVEILNDLLDLAKIEAGRLELTSQEFDLYTTLSNVRDLFEPLAARNNVAFRLDVSLRVPRYVCGDEMRVRQIVSNFVSNAVKFTHEGEIELGAISTEETVRVWVRDTGEGIQPDALTRLFSKYTQATASTARKHGGTGLGLAITKELATLMGGSVGATSEPGKGSIFWLEIPLRSITDVAKVNSRAEFSIA